MAAAGQSICTSPPEIAPILRKHVNALSHLLARDAPSSLIADMTPDTCEIG